MKKFLLAVVLLMQMLAVPANAAKLKWSLVVQPAPGFGKVEYAGFYVDGSGGGVLIVADSNASETPIIRMMWVSSAGRIRAEALFPDMPVLQVTGAKVTFYNDTTMTITTCTITGGKVVRSDLPLVGAFNAFASPYVGGSLLYDRLGLFTSESDATRVTLRRYTY